MGVQRCTSDGSGYGACECADASIDGAAGSGGASGASGAGGSSTGGGSGAGGASGSGGSSGSSGTGGGGTGGAAGDAGGSCPTGSATNVTGACDLVTQNCSGTLKCRVEQTDAGTYTTACLDLGNGPKKLGEACSSHNDCASPFICALNKCTRPCCGEQEAALCGTGQCDMSINYGSQGAFVNVCTFSPPCTPWAHDCPTGPESDCHLGSGGKLKCSFPSYALDGGTTLGKPCKYLNDCADSQQCDYAGASGFCRWLCKVNASGGPDAGTVGGSPGNGGCPAGEKCVAYNNPSWLGVCRP